MSAVVLRLIEQVKALTDEEREEFDNELRMIFNRELDEVLERLRDGAERDGITEEQIDQAITRHRYGR